MDPDIFIDNLLIQFFFIKFVLFMKELFIINILKTK